MPATEAELRAALEKAEQENTKLRADLEKAAKKTKKVKPTPANPDPDHDGDDDLTPAGDTDHAYHPAHKGGGKMSKAEEVAKAELEAVQKAADERIQKAEEKAAKAERIAKQERDLRVLAERVEFAKSELPHIGNPTEIGAELVKLEQALSKEEYDAHVTRQRALNAQIEKGDLFKQYGVDGSPDPSSADAVDKVAKEAAELRKADNHLDGYDAKRAALRAQPDLLLSNR